MRAQLKSVCEVAGLALLAGCGAASGLWIPEGSSSSKDDGTTANGIVDASAERPGSTPDASSAFDAATDTWSPLCPTAAPNAASSCDVAGIVCEYSGATDASCDVFATCSDGLWTIGQPAGSTLGCPASANPAECPAAISALETGSSCSVAAVCTYPMGICACSPVILPEVTAPELIWSCGSNAGCPDVPPRLGADCPMADTTCTYPPCVGVTCTPPGLWQPVTISCGG